MRLRFAEETIHLNNVQVECIVGVNPHERTTPQPLLISLSFPADFGPAAESEALEHTTDYSAVARAARAFVQEGRFLLLETLARRLAEHLCGHFGLARLHLHVRKPNAVAGSDGPAVSLTATREDGAAGSPTP